ncbi:uncharacterized protein LOC124896687 [Capsicum annuum]|uniref:uncharacterized protein LOC124896687 n=1 Tax=Capsicum annuum TaxID=4072 RepID=UPI001FB15969|nr:uncharacterized protein LOC124896687 [Capsicum annuum]
MGTSCRTLVVRGVGILVNEELRGQVVKVKKVSDRVMTIKLILEGSSLNICCAYVPQAGLDEEEKKRFWEVLYEVVRGVPSLEMIFIGGDFSGHIGFGDRNVEGDPLLDFARAFGLVVVNSSFLKKEEHLFTFCSRIAKTHINFLLLRKRDREICKDYKGSWSIPESVAILAIVSILKLRRSGRLFARCEGAGRRGLTRFWWIFGSFLAEQG